MKREGKSICYAIRFHAGLTRFLPLDSLTMLLFRKNSSHSPLCTGERMMGKRFHHPLLGYAVPSQVPPLVTTFLVSAEKLVGLNGVLGILFLRRHDVMLFASLCAAADSSSCYDRKQESGQGKESVDTHYI